jgi:RNA polymerase sigma factor (sigma-70 family)
MGVIGYVAEARRLGDAETRQPGEGAGVPQQGTWLGGQQRREGAVPEHAASFRADSARGTDIASLVRRAADGDKWAWERLVDQYARLIWAMTRDFKLIESDAADVAQATWLRLLEHIDRLDHPARVGAWLATTARHECLRSLAARKRIVLMHDDSVLAEGEAPGPALDERLLADERAQAVREALSHLPWRWQRLLQMLMSDPPASYAEISDELGLPVGSIGPTRGRCLERLRVLLEAS